MIKQALTALMMLVLALWYVAPRDWHAPSDDGIRPQNEPIGQTDGLVSGSTNWYVISAPSNYMCVASNSNGMITSMTELATATSGQVCTLGDATSSWKYEP